MSVRDADEAEAALLGGATLIDVKEPANGPLGKADSAMIAAVVNRVHGRLPVSAAMGELADETFEIPPGVQFAKWGLAKCRPGVRWRERLDLLQQRNPDVEIVTVGYADWECAQAPSIDNVLEFACDRGGVFLIDTCCKEATGFRQRPTLLDWLDETWLRGAVARCRQSAVRIALAGSLSEDLIRQLTGLAPDWFAVRGSACEGGDRGATVNAGRVASLASILDAAWYPST
ncbi:MAG: (5-formylfuran-3-yl)methyl phosphate synthase [Gemmataceae bacterium]|nr:(5-formylfuran-3-yl)methyl phosphate synthase [Gemmataceae bacterium]